MRIKEHSIPKIKAYFDEQRESYDKEADLCRIESKKYRLDTKERKYFDDRTWNCANMVLKMTSIEQQIIKLI